MKDYSLVPAAHELLKRGAERHPNQEAVYDGTRRLSYAELEKESAALAQALLSLGVEKGDHVAVSLPNWHEFTVVLFTLSKIGAVIVPLNTKYKETEMEYILTNAKVKAAFFCESAEDNPLAEHFFRISEKSKYVEHFITVRFEHERAHSYHSLVDYGQGQDRELPDVSSKQPFAIMYTSGTTGKPKGAVLTHYNVVTTAEMTSEFMECTSDDVFLVPVPLFHIFGMVPSILTAAAASSKIVLLESFKAEKALQLIEQERVTVHHGVPTMFILELNHPRLQTYDLTSLRTGIAAAAPVPEEIVKKIRKEMNCEILVSYGMTEASPCLTATTFDDPDELRAETVGKAMPGVELKIVEQQSRESVKPGEVGEIVARTPGIMKGYYEMPEKTSEVLSSDGWYATGDLGTMDEDGYVRIAGRKKDLIIRGGYNIYPREVEEYFYKHQAVSEVAIIGLPDSVLGEVSCAVIKLKEEKAATEDDMRSFIRDKVAYYKVPDKFVFVPSLPMTASGKISRIALQKQMKQELETELK
ncbi:fatty-acyl-CoA synthase/long-chain acyl-CoA synthetase [Alteribacillus persepolensis]|uniref:Fatty-acyl-CoA synthase/long-chain acyl-CoA synthetase n=1 Tax=Alteribacillus persepolensis TaxID=568899 RepID=A0A1G8A8G0_9BACI|nr:long-chain-fatty-acid--CoA ligase [Alteribacillus persepolensis]SDH17208.1 fatty-acyl-CoA synthase/long-chain acyl-CoA synthetase [Alteribacillus persepolensis]